MSAKNRRGLLGLTARETEVLTWIAQGKTNHEIGVILSACTGTICKHVEHILCKLDVKNRTAAAVIALAALAKRKNMSRLLVRSKPRYKLLSPRQQSIIASNVRGFAVIAADVRSQDLLRGCLARIRT